MGDHKFDQLPRKEIFMDKDTKADKKPESTKKTAAIAEDPTEASNSAKAPKKIKKSVKKKIRKKQPASKRFLTASGLVDKDTVYEISDAIELAKKTSTTKFDGSIEAHFRLGINVKKGDQQVRGTASLPHGTGKTLRVAAIVAEGKEKDAKDAGADIVGSLEFIQQLKQTGKIDFDIIVATPDMMPKMAPVAKILGPKGMMPSPKNETITTDIKKTVSELKKGKVSFKNDDTGNVHVMIGKVSFDTNKLAENFTTLLGEIKRLKPSSSKGTYLKNVSINSTMGPGIRISL